MSLERNPESSDLLVSRESLLSRQAILRHMELGNIVIDEFKPENLKTVSYDVTLGPWFFRPSLHEAPLYYNPWDELSVRGYWGQKQFAKEAIDIFGGNLPATVQKADKVILLRPSELILAHTNEFIGGRNIVTTMMKARSSMGRSGITVCKCAGWGDVGYINRWTMEIKNELPINNLLIVGERVAQLAFFEVDPLGDANYAGEMGKYQTSQDLAVLKESWHPDQMLPKLWLDR